MALNNWRVSEEVVSEAQDLLARVLSSGQASFPPDLTDSLNAAFGKFMYSGETEMGRDFYVTIYVKEGSSLLMARCVGVTSLQQLSMGRVAGCLRMAGREGDRVVKLDQLGLPGRLKEELKLYL